MAATAGVIPTTTTVLQHRYTSQAGREQGSISASIFTSESGEPAGRWKAATVYQPAEVSEVKADGQLYSRYEGYIESKPGVYFGIVLQWRSSNGALTKTWKLDDDLVAYYYLDGRPLPCMRYAIYQPGGKNPLPLSGLWPDNDTRYPLKWEKRSTYPDSRVLSDDLYASSDETCPVLPPLFSADDLGSIRITLHHKSDEESSRYKRFEDSPMPYNINVREEDNLKLYRDRNSTESVALQAPDDVSEDQLEEIFSGREAPAKSLPFLEFRIYYKNRETLQRIGVIPEEPPEAASSSRSHWNGHAEISQSRYATTNGQNGSSSQHHKRLRTSDTLETAVAANGHRTVESASRSASPLPPPLASRSLTSNAGASASRSHHDQSEGPSSSAKRVKPEPYSSPNRLRDMGAATDTVIPEDTYNELPLQQQDDEEMFEDAPAAVMSPADRGASPPPPADAESQQSSASEFFVAPAAPVTEQRQSTPSVEVQKASPKAEAPSPHLPSAAQRLASKLQSPMSSQSQALSQSQSQSQMSFFGNASQSQSAAQEARELEAEAFLNEDALDIAEPENVQALLSVGFRTKKKFLSRLPHCDQKTRDKIFADLEAQMEALDYGVLRAYLLKHCQL